MILFRPLKTPKALTFDLDDTLYDNWPIIRNAESQLTTFLEQQHPKIAGLGKSGWRLARHFCIAQEPRLASDMTRLRKAVLTKLASDIGYSQREQKSLAEDGYSVFYTARSRFNLNETIYSLLKSLKSVCPLVAITNGNVDLQSVGIAELFETSFQASVEQPMKPNPDMFNAAIEFLSMPPSDILHVGDHLIKDVWGAHQLGMQTAWYAINRPMQLRNESVKVLPYVQLNSLDELLRIIPSQA